MFFTFILFFFLSIHEASSSQPESEFIPEEQDRPIISTMQDVAQVINNYQRKKNHHLLYSFLRECDLPDFLFQQLKEDQSKKYNEHGEVNQDFVITVTSAYLGVVLELGKEASQKDRTQEALEYFSSGIEKGEEFWCFFNNPKKFNAVGTPSYRFNFLKYFISCYDSKSRLCPLNGLDYVQKNVALYPILHQQLQLCGNKTLNLAHMKGEENYNYIITLLTILPYVKERKEYDTHMDIIENLLKELRQGSSYYLYQAEEQVQNIKDAQRSHPLFKEDFLKKTRPLSRKTRLKLQAQTTQAELKSLENSLMESDVPLPRQTLILSQKSSIKKQRRKIYLDCEVKKTDIFLDQRFNLLTRSILKLEESIFSDKNASYQNTSYSLLTIYGKEDANDLWAYATDFFNAQDFENAIQRLECLEVLTKGLSSEEQEMKAYIYFLLGQPETWDQLIQKKEEKKQRKKEKKKAQKIITIKETLILKEAMKELADSLPKSSQKPLSFSGKGMVENTTLPFSFTSSFSVEKPLKDKGDNFRRHWSDFPFEYIRIPHYQEKTELDYQPENQPEEVLKPYQQFFLLKNAFDTYRSLYDAKPKITSKDAEILLEAFGLIIEEASGKGSHAKATFEGSRIFEEDKKLIFTFPSINHSYPEGTMVIIPKWEGKHIPHYMKQALRFILEKRGIKSENVFKK